MIQLTHLSKHYSDGNRIITALNDISLSFRKGEFVVISGSSGSGKSTLLNILSGVDYATSGEYYFETVDTDSFSENDWDIFRCKNIGLIYQDFKLIEEYTARENIELAVSLLYSNKNKINKRVAKIIAKTGISDFADKKVKFLSGGQKQRVAIARTLAKKTNIILADEPTANLDEGNAKSIVDLLKKISKNKLVIVVTHNSKIFETVSTRNVVLSDGKVAKDEKLSNPQGRNTLTANNTTRNAKTLNFGLRKNKKTVIAVFFTILLALFCSLALYSVCLDMVNQDNEGLMNTEYFQNLAEDRYVVTKIDGNEFSEDELTKIKNDEGIKRVVCQDIVLDNLVYVSNPSANKELELYARPISELEKVDYGRLPENTDEIVISTDNGLPYYMMESQDDYHSLHIDRNVLYKIKVVGWVRDNKHFRQSAYISEELFDSLYAEVITDYLQISLENNDEKYYNHKICLDDRVPHGSVLFSNKSAIGKSFSLKLSNDPYNFEMANLTCEDIRSYTEIATEYSVYEQPIIINFEDYKKLVNSKYYQISVFSEAVPEVLNTYNVIYPNIINDEQPESDNIIQGLFWFITCAIISFILVLVSCFFLRNILKSEINICKIRLLIGFSKKHNKRYLLTRLCFATIPVILIIAILYFALYVYSLNPFMVENFVLLANIPLTQFLLLTLFIVLSFAFLLYKFVMKNSMPEAFDSHRRNSND